MVLYNIHTHLHSISQFNDYYIRYIVNTYPLEFDLLRRQQPAAKVFSCGIHPWYCHNYEPQFQKLRELIETKPTIIAIGEAGIDKLKGADLETQLSVFRLQAALAEEVSKPLIIHCVKGWAEIISVKKELNAKQPWIIHGFRGGIELTRQLVKQGFKFSIGKYFDHQAIHEIPITSLFLETDDSESSIVTIYSRVATVLGLKTTELINQISSNVKSTFKLTHKTSLVN